MTGAPRASNSAQRLERGDRGLARLGLDVQGNEQYLVVWERQSDGTLNPAFATWLKGELGKRFTVLVRYVVDSHSHFDDADGGSVFADTATFVGHENMPRNMDGRYPHMPGDMVDPNRNGAIDPAEIDIPTKAAPRICGMGPGFFASIDRSKDGLVPPAELQADIRPPDLVSRSGCGSRSAGARWT